MPGPIIILMHAGLQHLQIPDPVFGGTFPALVLYPTPQTAVGVMIGPFAWDATLDAPLASGKFPLCLISHGAGGSHLLYRSIATHLAREGWIVVCPEAPRDNRHDRSLAHTDESVTNRCIHLVQTLDTVLAHERYGRAIDAARIGLVGHSLGGCAALALAGAQPWSRQRTPIPVRTDPRFKAAVLMAPATGYYRGPGALDKVTTTLLVLSGEKDDITPAEQIRQDLRGLPSSAPAEFVVIEGAGHYSFLSPFPEAMRRPDFAPALDPAGFDRAGFHRELPGIIETFLARVLPKA